MANQIHWEKNIGRRLQLRDLHVFFAVAEKCSMAKAAAALGVSQPSVSATIAALESSLGVQLFDRSPKGVELTTFGKAVLTRGRAAFDELRQGIRDVEFLRQPDVGVVRVGCPELVAAGFLPSVIDILSRLHPRISLVVTQVNTPTLEYRELDERRLDLVFAMLAVQDAKSVPKDYEVERAHDSRWSRRRRSRASPT